MNSFDHGVGFENQIVALRRGAKNGTVVTKGIPNTFVFSTKKRRCPTLNPLVFGGSDFFHGGKGGRASSRKMQVLALKRE